MLPSKYTSSLANAANTEINSVLSTGATALGQSKPTGEVGFVAALVLGGVPAIASAWKKILQPNGYSVQMTGIFCHQTPQASFLDASSAKKQCELADLLIVVDDMTLGGSGKRFAALVQAKMAAAVGGKKLSGSGDLVQLHLLSNWPSFTLPKPYAPGARDFSTCKHPGHLIECGRYGLIERGTTPSWYQHAPNQTMPAGGNELGTFMAHMIESGQTGYGREATGLTDDWSLTVEELLNVTLSQKFAYVSGFSGRQPRQATALAYIISKDEKRDWELASTINGVPPSGGDRGPRDRDGGEGISAIHIKVSGGG